MIKQLKYTAFALIAVGIAATIYLSGMQTTFIACSPFLIFGLAVILCRNVISASCVLLALVVSLIFGLHSYYQAFWIHEGGEVDAVVLLVVPVAQATLGFLTLLIAFINWLIYRLKKHRRQTA